MGTVECKRSSNEVKTSIIRIKAKINFYLCSASSEGKMWRYVFLVVLFSQTLTALQIPKWSDVFSSLEPYKDPETLLLEEEDAGEARLGFVQLNSGSTSFNATLNLTG